MAEEKRAEKVKLIADVTGIEKQAKRKYWRDYYRTQRAKISAQVETNRATTLNETTPATSNPLGIKLE